MILVLALTVVWAFMVLWGCCLACRRAREAPGVTSVDGDRLRSAAVARCEAAAADAMSRCECGGMVPPDARRSGTKERNL